MATPVRFPKGVTNVGPNDACSMLPITSRTRVHYFFDDFDAFDATEVVGPWITTTEDNTTATIDLVDGDGGWVTITPSTVSDDNQLLYTRKEIFTVEAGKRMWYGVRMKMVTEYIEMGILAGLQVTGTTAVSTSQANWIGFVNNTSDDATMDFGITSGGTRVASALDIGGDMDGSFHTYEFEFDGVATFKYFVDGVHAGTVQTTTFPTTEMGLVLASISFTSGANNGVASFDWVYCAKERETTND